MDVRGCARYTHVPRLTASRLMILPCQHALMCIYRGASRFYPPRCIHPIPRASSRPRSTQARSKVPSPALRCSSGRRLGTCRPLRACGISVMLWGRSIICTVSSALYPLHCRIRRCRIQHCRIQHCRIRRCRIQHCRIRRCRIRHCRIRHCRIRHCGFYPHLQPSIITSNICCYSLPSPMHLHFHLPFHPHSIWRFALSQLKLLGSVPQLGGSLGGGSQRGGSAPTDELADPLSLALTRAGADRLLSTTVAQNHSTGLS